MTRNRIEVDEKLEAPFKFAHLVRLYNYVKPYNKKFFIALLMMIISNIAILSGPLLIKIVIDDMIPSKNVIGLILLSLLYLLNTAIGVVCLRKRILLMGEVAQYTLVDLRKDLFVHLQRLPFSYYDNRPHGKILIRVVNYVNSLNNLLKNGIINIFADLFNLVLIIIFMLIIDVKLTFVSIAGVPFLILALWLLKNSQRKRWQKVSSKQSNMNAYIHESIAGIKVTQSFAREEDNKKYFEDISGEVKDSWLSAVKVVHLIWPISENISVLTMCFVYFVSISMLKGGITVGVILAFTSYIGRFWGPIMNMANFYNMIIMAMAYLERIFETLDEEVEIKDIQNAKEMPRIVGEVTFKDVKFSYEKDVEILKGVNFKVNSGETIALVGETGSGKTTIINLISRFYDIDSGDIYIDNENIGEVSLKSLRKQMGIMMQDSFIFSGTIMDNIKYGKLDATDEEVIEASKTVMSHNFIKDLEDGYMTEVNERGSRLSVGERQLISFARTLIADPKILILDEATSSIDTKTEMALQKGLDGLLKNRTSFVVAHRLSTIKNADRIFYINKGKITESGSHDELIAQRGDYYNLFMAQYSIFKN